jgi:hypothetical protein
MNRYKFNKIYVRLLHWKPQDIVESKENLSVQEDVS